MDGLFELALVLLYWRIFISVISSISFAMFLSNSFESFTAGYCIILVFLGIGFGIVWQERADVKKSKDN
jgi:hypothetical protein